MEIHEIKAKGVTERVDHAKYKDKVAYPVFMKMRASPILSLFSLDAPGKLNHWDHVSFHERLAQGKEPELVFLNTHKGLVSFTKEHLPILRALSTELLNYQLEFMLKGEQALNKMRGKIGDVEIDGIRFVSTTEGNEPVVYRKADKEAEKALKDKPPGSTFKSKEGIEYIKLDSGEIIDKKVFDILKEYVG
ncbi:MAG: hypothetical protein J7K68_02105 [Candidatus Diapherotrites archaeon]|nr:hypothetical protein [Candidatus Diapherotrites archaeon]